MIRLLPVLLVACTTSPSVHIHIAYTQPGVTSTWQTFADQGARAWSEVDTEPSTSPECDYRWFAVAPVDCQITIALTIVPQSEIGGALGTTVRSTRHTSIAYELHDFEIESTVAHEVGHTLFDTDMHLPPGDVGIMSALTTWQLVPTDADEEWAAEAMR